ncbi:hypothetical protein [Paenibacillus thiaminolyticus]|uniref:hypothetical protein n=1 Tax=Paenibacillus thiaminolyticus TaxID=49283 RepID=UPI0011C3AC23|nr:hypothetical protein [Paenibacillus thiaminolyticus]
MKPLMLNPIGKIHVPDWWGHWPHCLEDRPRSIGQMSFNGAMNERPLYRPSKNTKSGSNIKFSSFVTQR